MLSFVCTLSIHMGQIAWVWCCPWTSGWTCGCTAMFSNCCCCFMGGRHFVMACSREELLKSLTCQLRTCSSSSCSCSRCCETMLCKPHVTTVGTFLCCAGQKDPMLTSVGLSGP
jgi:hypothetical protein